MQPDLVDGELYLAPNFPAPPNTDYLGYHNYIDEMMPAESPYLYGLHPNAEIGFLTTTSENLFRTVFEMQPRDAGKFLTSSKKYEKFIENNFRRIWRNNRHKRGQSKASSR